MDTLRQDLRYAWRRIRRYPGFTLIAILSLALGIGANTAIFTLVDAVLFTRPQLSNPDELVDVYYRQIGFEYATWSYPDFTDLGAVSDGVFSHVAASKMTFAQRDVGEGVETLSGELVSGEYFTVRGLRPAAGRLLGPEDDVAPGAHPVVVLSHAFWQRAYGGDPAAVGRDIRLNGGTYTIVGVAPEDWRGQMKGLEPAVYVPILMTDRLEPSTNQLGSRGSHSIFLTARLAPGATLEGARVVMDNFTQEMRAAHPDEWAPENGVRLVPSLDVIMNPMVDGVIMAVAGVLTIVVGLVLLIACANLASFLLAQARDRRREVAIRLALGARRTALIRQLLTETTLLALVGGAAGTVVAIVLLRALETADLPLPFPITLDLTPDAGVLAFTFVLSLVAGALFGLAPALQSTRPDLAPTLKDETAGGGRPRKVTARNVLVVGQVAASLVLLVVASLFVRSLVARSDIRVGFGEEPAAIVSFGMPTDRYPADEGRLLMNRVLNEVRALPSVVEAGITENIHLNLLNTNWTGVQVDGHTPPPGQDGFNIDDAEVDAGFFGAMGIDLLRGRVFDAGIDVPDAPRVAMVNQAFVERFWPGEDGVGRTFRIDTAQYSVVGVVETVKIRSMGEAPRPFLYRAYSQRYTSYPTLVARTRGPADGAAAEIFSILRSQDPDLVIVETKTMDRHLGGLLIPFRLGALVIGSVALLALVLAVIGLYGVVSYAVASRTREVGIRMSLGADRAKVVRLVMGGGVRLVAVGAGIGVVVAAAGAMLLRGLLYGVPPLDPVTFLVVPLLLAGVALLAAWVPARRASRIDPVRALKGP